MNNSSILIRKKLTDLAQQWRNEGTPSKYLFEFIISDLLEWKETNGITSGLWDTPPTMLTATLDDIVGQGIKTVEQFASFAGMEVMPLGAMQSSQTIIEECNKYHPSLLGLTVLRTYVFEDLKYIGNNIPSDTLLIVGGGPCLQWEPEIATQAGIHLVAKDVTDFIEFMLDFRPS